MLFRFQLSGFFFVFDEEIQLTLYHGELQIKFEYRHA
jgi:hypothetical protein